MINHALLNAYLDVLQSESSNNNEYDNRENVKKARENVLRVVTDLVKKASEEGVRKSKAHDAASHSNGCSSPDCLGQCMVR